MAKVGFIGLGTMGGHMAHNLLKAGHDVKAFDLAEPVVALAVERGATAAATAADAASAAFGTERLPSDLTDIPKNAKTILVIADDLEESHNVAALRIKDAVDPKKLPAREPARLNFSCRDPIS